jgi:hypothetical protein
LAKPRAVAEVEKVRAPSASARVRIRPAIVRGYRKSARDHKCRGRDRTFARVLDFLAGLRAPCFRHQSESQA